MPAFHMQQDVRFQHCDPAAMVFYPRYFEMINLTIEEWFRSGLGWDFHRMHEIDDRGIPTARIEVEFKAPSRLGDVLDWSLTVKRIGTSSLDLEIAATCDGEARLVCRSTLVQFVKSTGRPVAWTDGLKEKMADFSG
ncbi:MAG: acyl-CoA thioesterase [Nisaea sp.]|jgi:4-hydroxybenzoyl-CoA thioesterase|uniref:acyl-CoA thioesterase n=1 Tax=Nisaea sp. TaxID=2024842 RepID=UPI001B2921FA|nr:thioesterase family protein [Nisaea sp.]MBO6562119.1 acyl-CoA thioesterase [Nisaea sp.]